MREKWSFVFIGTSKNHNALHRTQCTHGTMCLSLGAVEMLLSQMSRSDTTTYGGTTSCFCGMESPVTISLPSTFQDSQRFRALLAPCRGNPAQFTLAINYRPLKIFENFFVHFLLLFVFYPTLFICCLLPCTDQIPSPAQVTLQLNLSSRHGWFETTFQLAT